MLLGGSLVEGIWQGGSADHPSVVDLRDPCPAVFTAPGGLFVFLGVEDGVHPFHGSDAASVHVLLCPFVSVGSSVLGSLSVVKFVVLLHVEGFGLVPEPVLSEAVGELADPAGPSVE